MIRVSIPSGEHPVWGKLYGMNRFLDKSRKNPMLVPIHASMIQRLLEKRAIGNFPEFSVECTRNTMRISGRVKMMAVSVAFTLVLKPSCFSGRNIHFEILKLTPADFEIIKNHLLDLPPFLTYRAGISSLDLNAFEVIKKIPAGEISGIEIRDDTVWVQISS